MDEQYKETLKEYLCGIVESGKDSIATLNGGACIEMMDRALQSILQNICDVNTTTEKRVAVMKITVKPSDDNRSIVGYKIEVPPPKLCGQEPIGNVADIKIDANGKGPYSEQKVQPQIPLFGNNVARIGGSKE